MWGIRLRRTRLRRHTPPTETLTPGDQPLRGSASYSSPRWSSPRLSVLGVAGIVVLALALLVLLFSLLHPEGLRRPGGYLDGEEPQRGDDGHRDGDRLPR